MVWSFASAAHQIFSCRCQCWQIISFRAPKRFGRWLRNTYANTLWSAPANTQSIWGGVMNEILIEAFRQKDWATKVLIAACADRSVDELTRPAAGFGSILATLNHLVLADAGYVASLGGGRAIWAVADNETNDF